MSRRELLHAQWGMGELAARRRVDRGTKKCVVNLNLVMCAACMFSGGLQLIRETFAVLQVNGHSAKLVDPFGMGAECAKRAFVPFLTFEGSYRKLVHPAILSRRRCFELWGEEHFVTQP